MPEHLITRDRVLEALAGHIGAERAAHAEDLVIEITESADGIDAGTRRLRRVVEELRNDGHHVCGLPAHGYYMAADESDLNATCQYLYSRSMTTLRQVAAMKRVSLPDLRGQLRLPS
ncbi:hypothetical protein [Salinisphaera orenii]|uniref:DNA-binding protein n=1 Tax=Salinisphaera orenii YIM 95161 TaxID=1051139 RepID=A0A423PRM9_9GAMM|nr:hypothetical protein [Salinisphaera halophila]ROO28228.1 hypothetical protein SAHL_10690 [Salinisphaera halophila YIM 95161]